MKDDVLRELCSVPTAPFAETRVVEYVERFVAARRGLKLSRDRAGNLLIEFAAGLPRKTLPRWVFAAHMDHPGFVAREMTGPRTLDAHFRGGVLGEYFKGSKIRFFDDAREVTGVVEGVTPGEDRPYPQSARVLVKEPVSPGSPGM